MSSSATLGDLFEGAEDDGAVSPDTLNGIEIEDLGAQIQAGMGIDVDDVTASEVTLVTMMPDDSGSIRFEGNAQLVRDGHNLVLDALSASKQSDGVLIHTRYLNGSVLYPYVTLDQAVRMDSSNYNPNLGTPLYDQSAVLLATVLAKSQSFAENGVPARSVTLIITDGADQHSTKQTPAGIRKLVIDMLASEQHIIAGMGIDDGSTDFGKVFRDMGIPDEWILTPGNSESEIRAAFQVFSQSAVRASQGAASFSQAGGFA